MNISAGKLDFDKLDNLLDVYGTTKKIYLEMSSKTFYMFTRSIYFECCAEYGQAPIDGITIHTYNQVPIVILQQLPYGEVRIVEVLA